MRMMPPEREAKPERGRGKIQGPILIVDVLDRVVLKFSNHLLLLEINVAFFFH